MSGRAIAAFMFRHNTIAGFDHRDLVQHKQLVTQAFDDNSCLSAE